MEIKKIYLSFRGTGSEKSRVSRREEMSISEVRKCSRLFTPVNSLIDQLHLTYKSFSKLFFDSVHMHFDYCTIIANKCTITADKCTITLLRIIS